MDKEGIWDWSEVQPLFASLGAQEVNEQNIKDWLAGWTEASSKADETYNRLYIATSVNTADKKAEKALADFMANTYPAWQAEEQKLKQKLLNSGLSVAGMEIPLRNMRAEADLFREENLPLTVQEEKINTRHDQIKGAQTVEWQGAERTVRYMEVVLRDKNRETRRAGWEKMAARQLADREAINENWRSYMKLRAQMAANAGMPDFRAYQWQAMKRFDYTPEDCKSFHHAIEEAVVPVVERLAARRRKKLGLESLRYYDLYVGLGEGKPLEPFEDGRELTDTAARIFEQVLPQFGEYFRQMDREGLLDLPNRVNKAEGAYSADLSWSRVPFVFANAVGIHDDVLSTLHEAGHAFHAFESFKLPYFQQFSESGLPMEFAEVASMGMEFLASRYLEQSSGGFYSKRDAAGAMVEHLEENLRFWPYMAIVDAFQHWAYEHPAEGADTEACDAQWMELEKRFRPYLDWSGFEDVMRTGWQRKDHIHQAPFYYIEYGLALLGAVQVWRNALADQGKAVEQYRSALALGGTVSLPKLFEAAGAKFAFDAKTLGEAAGLMESKLLEYEEMS